MSAHRTIPLDNFQLAGFAPGAGDPAAVATAEDGWIDAAVPGEVHQALVAAGRIEHPFYGANERRDAWVDEREWWYRSRFAAPETRPDDRARVEFEGLDTVADVWLNGTHLGHSENQFRPAEYDVTDLLRDANTLLVRLAPPLAHREPPPAVLAQLEMLGKAFASLMADTAQGPEAAAEAQASALAKALATTVRKAPFSWGWDFGPNIPSIGIWRPARLHVERDAAIRGCHVAAARLAQDRSQAEVRVAVEVESWTLPGAAPLAVRAKLASPGGRVWEAEVPVAPDGGAAFVFDMTDPELWWTCDLGGQPLHDVTVELLREGVVLDRFEDRVGLRTVTVDRSSDPEEGGRFFRFLLNGVPLFARGANWLPASQLVGSVPDETYRDRVRLARDGNFNMLRIWGGGIYEQDAFYAACDELGVLLWHDFMFACIDYPSDSPELREEVALEAEYQVRRLRNRACLAQWCGNNEAQVLHAASSGNLEPGPWGWDFYNRILPAAVARHDPFAHYWPGSPYGEAMETALREGGAGFAAMGGGLDGDWHSWAVWHGDIIPTGQTFPTKGDERHYRRYAEDRAKFVSEFGIHAAPDLSTLRRWIPEAELEVHSATFDLHNKDNPKDKGDELLAVTTGLPQGLEEYVEFTQAVQAEGMAFAIEHYRRRQPHTAGALMWEFNDVWPGITWSVVDFDGVPKSAYWAARRACAPVAVSFKDGYGGLELWLVNNSPAPVEDLAIDVETGQFGGAGLVAERVWGSAPVGGAVRVWSAPDKERGPDCYAWASSPDGAFPAARKYFAEVGQLRFGPSSLEAEPREGALRIRSTGHSYLVRVAQGGPGVRLSDNCFDLRDGEEKTVLVDGADPASLEVKAFPLRLR
jgi:beta-mannosidase